MLDMPGVIYNPSNLGGTVLLDGLDVCTNYNADLIEWEFSPGEVDATYRRSTGRHDFNIYNYDYEPGTLTLKFYVAGDTKRDMFNNASKLVNASKSPEMQIPEDDPSIFSSVLVDYSMEFTDVEWFVELTLEFKAVRHAEMVTYSGDSSNSVAIMNEGTMPSGILVKFKVSSALEQLVITVGDSAESQVIVFKTPTSEVWYSVNGMDGTVTDENGVNRILLTDLVKFPKVSPGNAKISFSENVAYVISFCPTYQI